VTVKEVKAVLVSLPANKAPGLDGILNEILKTLSLLIAEGLAKGIRRELVYGTLPERIKESVTVTLRKEGKKDYSLPGSYRLIALENTLAKIVEGIITVTGRTQRPIGKGFRHRHTSVRRYSRDHMMSNTTLYPATGRILEHPRARTGGWTPQETAMTAMMPRKAQPNAYHGGRVLTFFGGRLPP
jgi:hypothetical protein